MWFKGNLPDSLVNTAARIHVGVDFKKCPADKGWLLKITEQYPRFFVGRAHFLRPIHLSIKRWRGIQLIGARARRNRSPSFLFIKQQVQPYIQSIYDLTENTYINSTMA